MSTEVSLDGSRMLAIQHLKDDNAAQRAEIERLRAYVKQLEDHWNDIAYERDDLLKVKAVLLAACDALGAWMSAALDDPNVCAEMKADINAWFAAIKLAEGG